MPDWVRSPAALVDLHVLAYREYRDTESARHEAMGATASWVRGGRNGPTTFREEQPVTRALARAEMWAALAVLEFDTEGAPPAVPVPLEAMCRDLGVAHRAPVATSPVWARGVWDVLRWLTDDPLEQRKPPMAVPVRNDDGTIPTAEELYQRTMAAAPDKHWGPEERYALRNSTGVDVLRSQRLAARVDETIRLTRESA